MCDRGVLVLQGRDVCLELYLLGGNGIDRAHHLTQRITAHGREARFVRLFATVVAYLEAVNLCKLRDGGFPESKGCLGLERARQLQHESPCLQRSRHVFGREVEMLRKCVHAACACLASCVTRAEKFPCPQRQEPSLA